ncbi:hypothetical protein PUNSTDRAFT_139423 [Punctularia strigosozonata HHB-11173 SS5]|uniref:DUF6533 domain-containing protein n=1 Tax=Punctularia strigosozonata (strain HHB-11173) TaxID=741275 RepID=R7S112_PUNST|nr:uncharacterized protein PUNSTDRAFT_139423 [Punctularia strigosozonata HHB-11173 SS5]EIN03539.1 hypothetical protein PUNSTDRAFT_139423 [Punctularia strigosozonata HHB-11173 SS5]
MHLVDQPVHGSGSARTIQEAIDARVLGANALAALTFTFWDICITYDQEIERIWLASWRNPTKWLFLSFRYFSLAAQAGLLVQILDISHGTFFDNQQCHAWWMLQVVAIPIVITLVQVVLILRVCALYHHQWLIKSVLATLWIGSVSAAVIGTAVYIGRIRLNPICAPAEDAETREHAKDMFAITISVSFLLELVLAVLTLAKFIMALKQGWGRTPILSMVVRDGLWAFLLSLGCSIANLHVTVGKPSTSGIVSYCWTIAFLSFTGSRIVLNMRSFPSQPETQDDDLVHSNVNESRPMLTTHVFIDGECLPAASLLPPRKPRPMRIGSQQKFQETDRENSSTSEMDSQ